MDLLVWSNILSIILLLKDQQRIIRVGSTANVEAEDEILYSIHKDKIRSTRQIAHEVGVSS